MIYNWNSLFPSLVYMKHTSKQWDFGLLINDCQNLVNVRSHNVQPLQICLVVTKNDFICAKHFIQDRTYNCNSQLPKTRVSSETPNESQGGSSTFLGEISLKRYKTNKNPVYSKCLVRLLFCVFGTVLSVCFCMGKFVMVPLNLTLSTMFATFFFEHLFNLYFSIRVRHYNWVTLSFRQ